SAASMEQDHPVALNIATSVNDTDGSEVITKVVISGVPSGASLNHGTNLGGGAWELTTAQLAGLNLNPPTGFSGVIHLSVTSTVQEVNLGGLEVDPLDNIATKTVALDINLSKDDVPLLVQPETITVDETNLAATGVVTINDSIQANFFADAPGTFGATGGFTSAIPLTSNGVAVAVTVAGNTYTGSAGGDQIFTLHVNGNGTYTFNLTGVLDHPDPTNANESIALNFGIFAKDSDGDVVDGNVTVNVLDDAPKAHNDVNNFQQIAGHADGNVISGLNGGPGAADLGSQDVPTKVTAISFGSTTVTVPSTGTATIQGDHGSLAIKSDGSYVYTVKATPPVAHDYDIAMMLDVSGSMGSKSDANSRISLLVSAVKNLMGDFHSYSGGTVQVHIVPFGTTAGAGTTFNVTNDAGFANVLSYLSNLTGNGNTNYEAPLQSASNWLTSQSGSNATTISYFISDGLPNLYLNAAGEPTSGNLAAILADLNGSDGSNDIATIKSLSDEVIGVGINVGASISNIDVIDSDGHALNVVNPQDLDAALSSTNPIPTSTTDKFVYQLTDADGDPATATLTLNSEGPVVVPPTLVVNNGADDVIVKEDHSIFVPIVATLDPHGPATQALTVAVTGIDAAWHITNANGTYNAATGTWSITLAPGQNYNGGLTFAPPANKDVDMSGLNVSAKVTEPVTGLTSTVNDGFRIITDAVADIPNLTATSAGGEQDHPINLNIATSLNDTDGSETIAKIVISGVPAAGSLSAGVNLGGGVWELTTAQLSGLKLNPPAGFSGAINLSVASTAKEVALSGSEVDLNDNAATKTVTLSVNVSRDDIPVITEPAAKVVDETNLSSGAVTASGSVAVNYGADGPGTVTATGGVTSSVPLSSNGVPVVITPSATSPTLYTGKAGGETIFTFSIDAKGQYVFKLIGTLDHPITTDHNDSIQLQFAVSATDSDGDIVNSVVKVNVLDDGPNANDDGIVIDTTTASIGGNVVANDAFSQDTPNKVTAVSFGSTSVNVPTAGTATIEGSQGTLKLAADGTYTYTLKPTVNPDIVKDQFTYTLKDSDGDTDTAKLTIDLAHPSFVVGRNVDDVPGSTTPHEVGSGKGTITGAAGSDILVGDTGGATQENQPQDYNIVMMLDVSGSMGSKFDAGSRISLLAGAVKNLMADFHDYGNGAIQVHLVPFNTSTGTPATFMVTEDAGYAGVLNFLSGLDGNGVTNYEAPMQSAISWLKGTQPIADATTISYFVSDGEPNTYQNNSGQPTSGTVNQVLAQLSGAADGTNEIATLKALSDEVIGVGINIGSNISNI
ncbi:MAG TPA: VWA domain-containing protein, partial [Alphaproteobacteria bacterium]